MKPEVLFYIIIGILAINFIWDKILDYLNAQRYSEPIPDQLSDVYDLDDYQKSQDYKYEKYRFGWISSIVSMVATLMFFFLDGFAIVDSWARSVANSEIVIGLLFFGIIMAASSLLGLPFSYYNTFVIEEKYGFNKTTHKTFVFDKVKGLVMSVILGGGIYAVIVFFYEKLGENFWIYAWGLITVLSIFLNMFYARLIVPLFDKQTPLEEGPLREQIQAYAEKVGFNLKKIFVIDGSKRSTKANAYFSGFGSEKRVTLYDTLINDLDDDEIIAVLAHEVGHYKRNHIFINMLISIVSTGFLLWLFSLFVGQPIFSEALGVQQPSFHIGLVAFGLLYTPVSEILGIMMNLISRAFEYQADAYAKKTFASEPLIGALKKLSKNSLSNLTPHPLYVWYHYSHPTLLQRLIKLRAA